MLFSLVLCLSLLSFSSSDTISPLLCLHSSCDFQVPLDNATLTLPETCNVTTALKFCSMAVTLMYLTDTVIIQFNTIPTNDTLQILTVLPQMQLITASNLQYRCNSRSLCEWDYLKEVYHQYLHLNYSSLLEVVAPDSGFERPPLSEVIDIACIENGSEVLCEEGKCQAVTFFDGSQTWEGNCLGRSDFDQFMFKLEIITRYNDDVIPYYESSFTFQCYWNICNTFEMVKQIREVIKTEYEVQLLSLISATTTVKSSSMISSTTTTTTTTIINSSVISSTTTRMNTGCTHIDIGYHVLFILILSSSMTLLSTYCINFQSL